MSTVCVPLYDSLGENAIEYIVRHSDAVVVFAATEKLPQLLKGLSKSKGAVTAVVYWGRGDDEAAKGIKSLGCKVWQAGRQGGRQSVASSRSGAKYGKEGIKSLGAARRAAKCGIKSLGCKVWMARRASSRWGARCGKPDGKEGGKVWPVGVKGGIKTLRWKVRQEGQQVVASSRWGTSCGARATRKAPSRSDAGRGGRAARKALSRSDARCGREGGKEGMQSLGCNVAGRLARRAARVTARCGIESLGCKVRRERRAGWGGAAAARSGKAT
eukprot:366518-Chlamydomonas_euryale.AAC.6